MMQTSVQTIAVGLHRTANYSMQETNFQVL